MNSTHRTSQSPEPQAFALRQLLPGSGRYLWPHGRKDLQQPRLHRFRLLVLAKVTTMVVLNL